MTYYRNIVTGETKLPDRIGATMGVTWANSGAMLRSLGWRIEPELPPVADGYERGLVTWFDDDGTYCRAVYEDTPIADRLAREQESAAASAAQAQLDKPTELKSVENQFLSICEQLSGKRVKLGFAELEQAVNALMGSDPNAATGLSLKLLTIDAAGKRLGGLLWWDTCAWHAEIV